MSELGVARETFAKNTWKSSIFDKFLTGNGRSLAHGRLKKDSFNLSNVLIPHGKILPTIACANSSAEKS